jgi:ParB/RepB/Spo0J family partition protein
MTEAAEAVAAPAAEIARAAIDGAVHIPCSLIKPSKTNPRKRFDESYIASLAESIKKVRVFQPIVVRPLAGAVRGGPQYELVAGECRWRASQKAEQPTIPALVKDLDDLTMLEVQMAENIKRRNLHPLEEAEGYEQMLRKPNGTQGFTAEELASRFDVSVRYIYNRLALLKLAPFVREELYSDRLSASVALKIAALPQYQHEQACKECQQGWGGEPFSARQAAEHLQKKYMLSLGRAVFDIKDAKLLPKAGACPACPKRTGANPDLFEDVKSADTCTDPNCFEAKTKAHADREVKQAKASGVTVLVGAEAKKVMPYGEYSLAQTGHVRLDQAAEELTGTKQRLTTLLGDDFKGLVLLKPEHSDTTLKVAKLDDVKAALKEKGLFKPGVKQAPGQPTKLLTPDDIKRQRDRRIRDMIESRLPRAFAKHLADDGAFGLPDESPNWMRALADMLMRADGIDGGEIGNLVTGKHEPSFSTNWLKDAPIEQLVQAVLIAVIFDQWSIQPGSPKTADALAKEVGFDLPALRKEVAAEIDAAIRDEINALKAPLGKGAKAKPEAGKSGPGKVVMRYRDPATGDTWSGRGLQPAWLKARLAEGRTLAEFDIAGAGASTPSISAAAQGAQSAPQTPEQALAHALAQEQQGKAKAAAGAPKGGKGSKEVKDKTPKAPAKSKAKPTPAAAGGKKEVKDATTKPPTPQLSPVGAWPFPKGQQEQAA